MEPGWRDSHDWELRGRDVVAEIFSLFIYLIIYLPATLQVVSGNRAEAITVLLDVEGSYDRSQQLRAEEAPSFVVNSLDQLARLVRSDLQMLQPLEACT